jgi:hypothetical protein
MKTREKPAILLASEVSRSDDVSFSPAQTHDAHRDVSMGAAEFVLAHGLGTGSAPEWSRHREQS